MYISKEGIDLIKRFESCKLEAYLCPANIWTIGWGTTIYPNGMKVKRGDKITQLEADKYFIENLDKYVKAVDFFTCDTVNINQFSALCSFAYNCGIENLRKSTLLKLVNINPNDIKIRIEFLRWNKANGKVLNGLTNRRMAEIDIYFK